MQVNADIISKLRQLGVRIATDHFFTPGEYKLDELMEVLAQCRSVILIISPGFVEDPWCRDVAQHSCIDRHPVIPLMYGFTELDDTNIMFSNILSHWIPIYCQLVGITGRAAEDTE